MVGRGTDNNAVLSPREFCKGKGVHKGGGLGGISRDSVRESIIVKEITECPERGGAMGGFKCNTFIAASKKDKSLIMEES